jgi:Ca2+-binding EF-hand superfamily protein
LGHLALGVVAGGSLLLASSAFAGSDSAQIADKFAAMDTNQDGKISPDEHAVGAKMMFDKMDANRDGQVTAAEMQAARPDKGKGMPASEKIKVVDVNGDGAVSAEEHAAGAKAMFDKMDSDRDGYLTKSEMEAGHAKMTEKK